MNATSHILLSKSFYTPTSVSRFYFCLKNRGSSFNNSSYTEPVWRLGWSTPAFVQEEEVQYSWLYSNYLPAECLGPWLLQVSASSSRLESQFSLLGPSLTSCLYWAKRPGFMPAGPHSWAQQVFQAFRPQVFNLSLQRRHPGMKSKLSNIEDLKPVGKFQCWSICMVYVYILPSIALYGPWNCG